MSDSGFGSFDQTNGKVDGLEGDDRVRDANGELVEPQDVHPNLIEAIGEEFDDIVNGDHDGLSEADRDGAVTRNSEDGAR